MYARVTILQIILLILMLICAVMWAKYAWPRMFPLIYTETEIKRAKTKEKKWWRYFLIVDGLFFVLAVIMEIVY